MDWNFFSDDEGTGDGETWPSNLSDDVSDDDIARHAAARVERTAEPIMDLLSGRSIHRVCKLHGVDPQRPGGYVEVSAVRRVPFALIALVLFLVGGFVLGLSYR